MAARLSKEPLGVVLVVLVVVAVERGCVLQRELSYGR